MDIEESFLAEHIAALDAGLNEQEEAELQEVIEHLLNNMGVSNEDGKVEHDSVAMLMGLSYVAGRTYQADQQQGQEEFTFPLNLNRRQLTAFIEFLADRAQV